MIVYSRGPWRAHGRLGRGGYQLLWETFRRTLALLSILIASLLLVGTVKTSLAFVSRNPDCFFEHKANDEYKDGRYVPPSGMLHLQPTFAVHFALLYGWCFGFIVLGIGLWPHGWGRGKTQLAAVAGGICAIVIALHVIALWNPRGRVDISVDSDLPSEALRRLGGEITPEVILQRVPVPLRERLLGPSGEVAFRTQVEARPGGLRVVVIFAASTDFRRRCDCMELVQEFTNRALLPIIFIGPEDRQRVKEQQDSLLPQLAREGGEFRRFRDAVQWPGCDGSVPAPPPDPSSRAD